MLCFQSPNIFDAPLRSESCNSGEQPSAVEHDEQKLSSSCRNVFSSLQTTCIDSSVPFDTKCLILPKSECKHKADSAADVDACEQEHIDVDFKNPDYVQSIVVKLPLIARLRHSLCEKPVLCIKTEIADADKDYCAADKEDIKPPTSAEVELTDEIQAGSKKETTAAEKGQQLARETIASIFGTELQPPVMIKIPIKRRVERDVDEHGDAKRSRTFSGNDDVHDRQHSQYVIDRLRFCSNTVQ